MFTFEYESRVKDYSRIFERKINWQIGENLLKTFQSLCHNIFLVKEKKKLGRFQGNIALVGKTLFLECGAYKGSELYLKKKNG